MRQRPRQSKSTRPRRLRVESLEPRMPLAADITTGLIHHWTFDETTGDTAHDVAGGSDGTLVNWTPTEPKWESGRVGGALQFSTADNAVIATPPALTGSYAVSFWLNVTDRDGTNPRIFESRVGNEIAVNNDSSHGVAYYRPGNREATADPSQPTYNTWDHYVINFNVATAQGIVYRNGAPVAIGAYSESSSLATWVFGHSSDLNNTTDSLNGALDDLRIYNRVLKDDDVALLASQGTPEPTHVGPVHHWTFDETTGFTAHDIVGGADGTLIGWNQTEPRWVPGTVGGALAFTTANNAVVTPLISTQAQWSVAFWVNVTAHTGINPRIIEPWAYINFDSNQGMGFSYGNANTFDSSQVQLGKWEQYTITFDTVAAKGTIYRNGIAVKTGFLGGNSPAFELVFGHNQDLSNPNDSLNGLLDDLRIYDRLLAPSEIAELALTGDPQPVSTSLTHHWTFDETAGNTAADIVGGNDGDLRNWAANQSKWVTGKIGRAVSFNDADDLILTQSPITQDQYTFSFWLNQTGEGGFNPRIITPGDHREDWVIISQTIDNGVGFAGSDAQDPNVPVRNTWEQYVVTLDRLTEKAAVYRNGVKVDTGTFRELPPLLPWYMGHHSDLDIHIDTLHGLLDDMRIYNRVLTDAEALRLATGSFLLAANDSYNTQEDTLLIVSQALGVLANDSNLNTNSQATIEVNPLHGTVDLKVDGRFTYDPADNYSGPDSFVYRLTDNLGNFVLATVAITVDPINDLPTFTAGPNIEASDEQSALTNTTTIRFDDLTGAPDELFYHYTESGFTITAELGRWIEAHDPSHITGHPAPALYSDSYNSTLEIKRTAGGTFALAGFDLASWEFDFFATDSPAQYTVEGLLNGQLLYSSTGQVATSDFHAIDGLPGNFIDTLRFRMVRLDSQAHILDNIRLITSAAEFSTPVTFDALSGLTGQGEPFLPYSEAGLTVTPTNPAANAWKVFATSSPTPGAEGNPKPSIWVETFNSSLELTRTGGGTFAFAGLDLFGATVSYTFTGLFNGNTVFTENGIVPQAGGSFFVPIVSHSGAEIDKLKIQLVRNNSEYLAIDNIRFGEIPWATNISAGAPDEASQKLNFTVTTDKPELFEVQPAIAPSGNLTFVPKPNVDGLATVSVTLHDDGGDTSPTQTFTINIVKQYPWHNVAQNTDVDNDGEVTATDVIAIINHINAGLPDPISGSTPIGLPSGFLDVDGDNVISASDVIAVINAINAALPQPAAKFLGTDTATQGTWIGTFGDDGYALNSGPTSLPAGVQISFKSGLTEIYDYVHAASTNDPRALERPLQADRLAAEWTGDHGFVLDLNLPAGRAHRVALYMLDWDTTSRKQQIDVIDAETGQLLDSRVVESFDGGKYLTWTISGHVKFRFSNLANGLNAVLSGIFFG